MLSEESLSLVVIPNEARNLHQNVLPEIPPPSKACPAEGGSE